MRQPDPIHSGSSCVLFSDPRNRSDASHMVRSDGWSLLVPVPALTATSRRVTIIWDHFGVFLGLIFYRLSSRTEGIKACMEFHAGQTPWIRRFSQTCLLMPNHAVSSEKHKSLTSLWRNWEEATPLKSERGSSGRKVPAGLNQFISKSCIKKKH